MEHILQNLLCFITTHWTALAVYYSTWVNTARHLSYLEQCTCRPEASSAGLSPCTSSLLVFDQITVSSLPFIEEQVQEFVFLIWVLRDQLLLMDSFSSCQCQRVSLFATHSSAEMPKIWAHSLTFKLLKSRQAKFSAYFHVIVMHINTCMRFLPGSNADGLSPLTNTRDYIWATWW